MDWFAGRKSSRILVTALSLVKSVCSARDLGYGSLGYWMLEPRKYSRTKDSGFSYNQII